MNRSKGICFHGFLGSGLDFEPLNESLDIFALDLKPSILLRTKDFETWGQMLVRVQQDLEHYLVTLADSDEIYFFSYSMGSKVLFSIFENLIQKGSFEKFKKSPKIILISTHFGLYDDEAELIEETAQRELMNQKFINILENEGLSCFLESWNKLPLFADKTLEESTNKTIYTKWSFEQIKHYFRWWSQIQTKNILDSKDLKFKFFVFHGSLDLKYKQQSERLKTLELNNVSHFELASRSHRLLKHEDLIFILRKAQSEL